MLLYNKNRFLGTPEAIGTISTQFWDISGNICFLLCFDHFWNQIQQFWANIQSYWTNLGAIFDQLWDQKSDHLGTRHAGD